MSERDERVRSLADDIWDDFKGSKFVDITPRDAESIARTVLDSPAMRDLLAEERAKALREAADDVSLVLANEVGGHTSTYSVRNWLRKRAIEEAGR